MQDLARYRANPLQRGWRTCSKVVCRRGRRTDEAIATLERAIADGCRYRREWLERDSAFAALRDVSRFHDVVTRADRRYAETPRRPVRV